MHAPRKSLRLLRRSSMAMEEEHEEPEIDSVQEKLSTHNILRSEDGHIYKPLQDQDGNGQAERLFYEQSQACGIAKFCPRYFGCKKLEETGKDWDWMELEDLTAGCKMPAVMDLKMGSKKFYAVAAAKGCAESYPPEKVQRQAAEDLKRTSHSLGFLISGCKVPGTNGGNAFAQNEEFGKAATDDEAREAVRSFIKFGAGDCTRQIAAAIAGQLEELLTWFKKEHTHVFYNASLLFAFDSAEPQATDRAKVRLIDFCHSWKRGEDEEDVSGVASGLQTLVDVFTGLKNAPKLKKPVWTKVKDVNPNSKGLNLMLKVVNVERDPTANQETLEVVAGDESGVVSLRLISEEHRRVCKRDASIRVQNARILMRGGFIRVIVDKWGVLKAADSSHDFDANIGNDLSATEYELTE